ncbi:hypothetical protein FHW00_002809 [Ochrobactrum sp. P6BSIII]|nr:hypothetical protein [Ochrobactrum sp. P6BSIII]
MLETQFQCWKDEKTPSGSIQWTLAFQHLHRPYASMNWIRFNGSLRTLAVSQPLAGTPLVNA